MRVAMPRHLEAGSSLDGQGLRAAFLLLQSVLVRKMQTEPLNDSSQTSSKGVGELPQSLLAPFIAPECSVVSTDGWSLYMSAPKRFRFPVIRVSSSVFASDTSVRAVAPFGPCRVRGVRGRMGSASTCQNSLKGVPCYSFGISLDS